MTITVFSSENCSRCRMTKKLLSSKGHSFEEKMIEDHPDLIDELREADKIQMPYVVVESADGQKIDWNGFRADKINSLGSFGEMFEATA